MLILTRNINHILKDTIEKIGFEVKILANYEEVKQYIKSKAVFIDLNEFSYDIKFTENFCFRKIGITDEKTSCETKKAAVESGFSMLINKNVDENELFLIFKSLGIFKNFEEQLVYEINSAKSFFNQLSVPIFIKDKNSIFKVCNDAFCKYLGFKREEILGKTSDFFSPKRKAQIYEEIDRLVIESGNSRSYEGMVSYAGDDISSIIIQKSPLYDDLGNIYGILGVITDISERKKKEKELKSAMKKAEESDKLKSSFLSNMSHEIRTPMNAIVGFSQLLSSQNLKEEKKQIYIEQVNSNAEILLQLIEDIIEVSKIEAGKISIKNSTCFVNKMLDELHTSFEAHKARQGKTHIHLNLKKADENPSFNIITDCHRLNQILTNLLGNAIKFTEEGNVEFGYNFSEENNQKYVKFYVKDTGLGINKEKMEYVFDRFSKIPASKTKLYGGTGLGLSISKSLTEMLGGTISLQSEENVGSTFHFTIPFVTDNIQMTALKDNLSKKHGNLANYFWEGKTILIAEDEEMNYLYLQEVLRETKASVIWRQNGKLALSEMQSNDYVDLILMDIKMPQMDGYDATKAIREINKKVPIIIQTAYAMPAERAKGIECGCDEYLEKPIKQKDLLEMIGKYFSEKPGV